MISLAELEKLLPRAAAWAEEQEQIALRTGVPLTNPEIADARLIGLKNPKFVRLLEVAKIPVPEDAELRVAAQAVKLISSGTRGLALRYGIFIRSDFWRERPLVAHELVHTSQYERFGGILPFLHQYLNECVTIGYPAAPLEQEAIRIASRFAA